jgi:predicted Zn-dependent peptidase
VDDPGGRTGVAHLIEHLAYKGTESIGTSDWASEKKLLDGLEDAYDRLEAEKNKGSKSDVGRIGAAEVVVNRIRASAQTFVKPNEFRRIFEENGGVGIVATAGTDRTEFTASLPSNRIELWFLMESQRLIRPVFREFYKEREALLEEYKEKVEGSPQNRAGYALLASAITAHPYRNPGAGWPSDVARLRVRDAREFFDRYYVAGNISFAIVGDVDAAEARKLAERYFGTMPSKPMPPPVHTEEPPQTGPRSALLEAPGQPIMMLGYHRPAQSEPDDTVLDIIQLILGGGRTGLLHRSLVQEKRAALGTQCIATYPGGRYPNLFTIAVLLAPGRTPDDTQKAVEEILGGLANQTIDPASLARAKTQVLGTFLGRLGSNAGLAFFLNVYQGAYGGWRKMFESVDQLNQVTATDVQRVVRKYLKPSNRTMALTLPPPPVVVAPAKPAGVRR